MQVARYTDGDAETWDRLVALAPAGTFLHTRRFLAYHGDRFADMSVLLLDQHGTVRGVLPAALDPADPRRVVSHPGITFGGLVHDGSIAGTSMLDAFAALRRHYAALGMRVLRYKAVPWIYHGQPGADDLYAAFHAGAVRTRCELSCAIDLANRRAPSSRRKRALKKALSAGVEVVDGAELVDDLWRVIGDNLARKLGERPVHTVDEMRMLSARFPENIRFLAGRVDGRVVAGLVLFAGAAVTRAQYIASSTEGYDVSALDAVVERAVEQAREQGRRYFDFGTSNTDQGRELSGGVYQFKWEFGGGGVVQEQYDIPVTASD